MKSSLVVALFSLLLLMNVTAQTNYSIHGNINGLLDNSKVYLINPELGKRIDSAVVHDKKFELKGHLTEFAFTYLYLEKSVKLADILLDNRQVNVTGSAPIYDSITVSGSIIDEEWRQWFKEDERFRGMWYRLHKISKSLLTIKDTIHSNQVLQVADELTAERIILLKTYVKKYKDSPSSVVLPSLCTLQKYLTKTDYLEMYNSLSFAMRNTSLGKEMKELSTKSK